MPRYKSYRTRRLVIRPLRVSDHRAWCESLEAAMDVKNKPSIALAQAVGLHDEGVKKHYWFQNGRWEDQRVFIAVPELFR